MTGLQTSLLSQLIKDSAFFSSELEKNLEQIILVAAPLLQTARASYWQYAADYSRIECKILYELATERLTQDVEYLDLDGDPSYRETHQQASIVAVDDVYSDVKTSGIPREYFNRYHISSLIDVPVWLRGRLAGLLSFEHVGEQRAWQEQELELAQVVGFLASFCLEAQSNLESQRAHARSEHRFERAFENIPDVVAIYDKDLRVAFINEATARLTGRPNHDFIGRRDDENWPPEVHSRHLPVFEEAMQTGEFQELEFEVDIPGRGKTFLHTRCSPLLSADGEVEELLVVTRDLTESRVAQQKLMASEKRYRALFENMPSGFVLFEAVLDGAGSAQDLVIVSANAKFAETTGLVVEEVLGHRLTSVLPGIENDAAAWIDLYGNVALTGEPIQMDGFSELLGNYYTVTAYRAGPGLCAVNFLDISARKKAEIALEASLSGTIKAISKAVEARDPYTAGHESRVADIACAIGKEMGLSDYQIQGLRMGAEIHDIGKIQLPAEILTKPTRLNEYEFAMIKNHPGVGAEILKDVEFPWPVADIAHQHHERLYGSGYPRGLKGDEICLEARIVSVADVVEAISAYRPYRPALGPEVAMDEIKKNRGRLYDPQVVDACLKAYDNGRFEL